MRIKTERLILRTWQESDLKPFLQINQDPKVMEFFSSLRGREETKSWIQRFMDHFNQYGYTFYAVELRKPARPFGPRVFLGFVGMMHVSFKTHFTPAVEIGWRIASEHWGNGYATEAAKVVLNLAFNKFNLGEVVSFAVVANRKSRRVMEKIGMEYVEDFDHPKIDKTSPLCRHALYRIKQQDYFNRKKELMLKILKGDMLDAMEDFSDEQYKFEITITPFDVTNVVKRYLADEISSKNLQRWADFMLYKGVFVTPLHKDEDFYEVMWDVLQRISSPFIGGELTHDRVSQYLSELRKAY